MAIGKKEKVAYGLQIKFHFLNEKKQNKKTNILRTIEQQQKPDNNNKIVILSHQIENQSRECCTYGVRYWRARATNKQTNGSEKSKFKKVVCFGFFLFYFCLIWFESAFI